MFTENGFGIEIEVKGSPLKEYTKNGFSYVAAPCDQDYQLRFHVPQRRFSSAESGFRSSSFSIRYAAVCSEDGWDIQTGKPASASAGGYVISRYTNTPIQSYRLNASEFARLRFGDRKDSGAGTPINNGVIAVVFYGEKIRLSPSCRPYSPYVNCVRKSDSLVRGAGEQARAAVQRHDQGAAAPYRHQAVPREAGRGRHHRTRQVMWTSVWCSSIARMSTR